MAKRKAVMKDIIYELDNDDIEISSDDEVIKPKANRSELKTKDPEVLEREKVAECEQNGTDKAIVVLSQDVVCVADSPPPTTNGGKTFPYTISISDSPEVKKVSVDNSPVDNEIDSAKKTNLDCSKTTIFNEDIEIDSPASNELRPAGCENRTPLVTVRFGNSKLASNYKERIKEFMLKLIREHDEDNSIDSDNETDLELDIWPDDITEECADEDKAELADSLFFVDTAPCNNLIQDIPEYRQASSLISNAPEKLQSPPRCFRRPPTCFNCDGAHSLRDCKLPRNNLRIEERRKTAQKQKVGRYHIEDEQKYGHLIPGRISGQLRHALGLKRNELPLHIYKMRMLGYPPGWLEEARISHSGITMFDSSGNAIMDPDEEDGEIAEAGSKDKFDIKKILDFPGFNVPASSRYQEQSHLFGMPPMSEQDSKIAMLQMLAPNAMKAYKRKKLTFFPSSTNNSFQEGQAEMELDSGDEAAAFPSVPPLPDEAPPPQPPPPPPPTEPPPPPSPPSPPPDSPAKETPPTSNKPDQDGSTSDVEVINVIQVSEIPMPEDTLITIDEDNSDSGKLPGCSSPTLDDLEKKKQILLEALDVSSLGSGDISISDGAETEVDKVKEKKKDEVAIETDINSQENISETITQSSAPEDNKDKNVNNDECTNSPASVGTPEPKAGHVKTTQYGTPVLNIASPYSKLPSDDKFSKDICDVINFENLPNSIGKYKQICTLLKKVKNEVDRIQDS